MKLKKSFKTFQLISYAVFTLLMVGLIIFAVIRKAELVKSFKSSYQDLLSPYGYYENHSYDNDRAIKYLADYPTDNLQSSIRISIEYSLPGYHITDCEFKFYVLEDQQYELMDKLIPQVNVSQYREIIEKAIAEKLYTNDDNNYYMLRNLHKGYSIIIFKNNYHNELYDHYIIIDITMRYFETP